MRRLILLLLVACATTKTTEQHSEIQNSESALLSESKRVDQHTEAGPETITTTVEEYGLGDAAPALARRPASDIRPQDARGSNPPNHESDAATLPEKVVLVKRTVTVDQRGPVLQDTHLQGQGSLRAHAEAKVEAEAQTASKSKPSTGCALGLGFGGVLAIAVLLAAALLYLRLRSLP